MDNNNQLNTSNFEKLIQADSIDDLSLDEIEAFFIKEYQNSDSKPNPVYQIDPRNNEPIFYNASRSVRPHTYSSTGDSAQEKPCPICSGHTTGILDWTPLSEGVTFINKNLFPVLFPYDKADLQSQNKTEKLQSFQTQLPFARGLHFLQWTSSLHDNKWSNMPDEDCYIVMKRLAALERKLLEMNDDEDTTYVTIYKNAGRLVGSSLVHDHQQILLSNVMPKRVAEHIAFQKANDISFSQYLLEQNPQKLTLYDFGQAVLFVPYFMKRPYNMILAVKDSSRSYCHQLNDHEIQSIAKGWKSGIMTIENIFSLLHKEVAYNIVTHNGPGCGLYFEFLPYTQEYGGLEHSGMTLCQGDPYITADQLREVIGVN